MTEHEKRLKQHNRDLSFNVVVKIRSGDISKIAHLLKDVPHEIVKKNFEFNEYFESSINK